MIHQERHQTTLLYVLIEHLINHDLPRALQIQRKVDRGLPLDDFDIRFLNHLGEDVTNIKPLIDESPQHHDLMLHIIYLYKHITDTALRNERALSKH